MSGESASIVYISAPDRAEHALRVGDERTVCGFAPDLDWWTVTGSEPLIEAFVCKSCSWSLGLEDRPKPTPRRSGWIPRQHLWDVRISPGLQEFCERVEGEGA